MVKNNNSPGKGLKQLNMINTMKGRSKPPGDTTNNYSGFVYEWINKTNGKWYIGSHKGTPDDGYTASGIAINKAFEKYGLDNFIRRVFLCNNFTEIEENVLTRKDAANDPMSYNMTNEARGFGHINNCEKQKKRNVEHLKELARQGKNGYWTGRKHSEESKRKIGLRTIERATAVVIDGIRYESGGLAEKATGIKRPTIRYRAMSPNFKNYYYETQRN